jgi:hypothetical protein
MSHMTTIAEAIEAAKQRHPAGKGRTMRMIRTYQVKVTTEDWDEYTYPVTTGRGALAATQAAAFAHSKAGFLLSDVRSVVASASGEHETTEVAQ